MPAKNRYLVVGGAPKCGTTSLFRYLADHPDICPSHRKETYFFAREFDLKNVSVPGETLADFENYFFHCDDSSKLRLEATPYTLYAKEAPQKIAALIDNALVLFVLRHPVKRLISDYQFHLQRGHPSTAGSVQEFLAWQSRMKGDIPGLIDQGCYIRFLQRFITTLGADRIITLFFEDLVSDPLGELQKLCRLLGIDDSFYPTYNFKTHNPTISYRSALLNRVYIGLEPVIANTRSSLMKKRKLHNMFEHVVDLGKSVYRLINSQRSRKQAVFSDEVLQDMAVYYQPYNELLHKEIGCQLPW